MIKVLHKALNILEFISRSPDGQTLTAIAENIGERTTTTSNIVQVLASRSYLERVDGRWKLGLSAYMLIGSTLDYDRTLCNIAEPILKQLAADTAATAVLSIWRSGERFVLLRIADNSAVTVNRSFPEATEVYRTATGMMLLAVQNSETIDAYIASHGIPDIKAPSESASAVFKATLELSRQKGYYVREKEDVFEAAAPVYSGNGAKTTAVGIYLPLFRAESSEFLISKLLDASERIGLLTEKRGVM